MGLTSKFHAFILKLSTGVIVLLAEIVSLFFPASTAEVTEFYESLPINKFANDGTGE